MRKFFSFVMGALMGALVGGTVGVLMAPASGTDLRSQLRQRVMRLQDEIKEAASARRAELEAELASLRSPRHPLD